MLFTKQYPGSIYLFIFYFYYQAMFVPAVVLLDLICSSSGRTCLFGAFVCGVAAASLMNPPPTHTNCRQNSRWTLVRHTHTRATSLNI